MKRLLVFLMAMSIILPSFPALSFAEDLSNVTFYNQADGTPIKSLDEASDVYAEVTFDATSDSSTVVAAHYDHSGMLTKTEFINPISSVSGQNVTYTTPSFSVKNSDVVKIFAWDGLSSMIPLLKTPGVISKSVPLPTATINTLDTSLISVPLTFAMNFKADEATEEQLIVYGDWYSDFVLTVNKDVKYNADGTTDAYLAGQYDSWSSSWLAVPNKTYEVKADNPIKIMESAAAIYGEPGLKYTYREVYERVKNFNCGVFFGEEFLAENPDLKATLELRIYNPKDATQSYRIGECYEFTTTAADDVATVLTAGNVTAVVPSSAVLENGIEGLKLTTTSLADSQSGISADENEKLTSYDIHIEGVSKDNTTPIIITLPEAADKGLNKGNLALYHVENGKTVAMEEVETEEDLVKHNQFTYEPLDGTITLAIATFSEVALLSDTDNAWNGDVITSWYDVNKNEFKIANADQFAGLGNLVCGGTSFEGKTITLTNDINMGGDSCKVDGKLQFYPIGYTSDGYGGTPFMGTFDGAGHKISNVRQNTWEMLGTYDGDYYNAAMGVFGYVVDATIKNLTVDNFSCESEFGTAGVIANCADGICHFENIAITNCEPYTYNNNCAGILATDGGDEGNEFYFKNITIDNTNTIGALWGTYDGVCAGIMCSLKPDTKVTMENCHVAAKLDVYNDVCGNYQYYWYRYSGMLIGRVKNTVEWNGYDIPDVSKVTATNCTVNFGDWNDYYYCELVANTIASYTHDHQFSRLNQISTLDEIKSGNTWTKEGNFLLISEDTKTCYHIVKDTDGTLKQHNHEDSGTETVNGQTVLKEDKQIVYLPFNQLFTGTGWGIRGLDLDDLNIGGITVLGNVDVEEGEDESVEKFTKADNAKDEYFTGTTVKIGELFKATTQSEVNIIDADVQVFVSPVDENSTVTAKYVANETDWTEGTLTFSGTGTATVTITDYYFCKPTTITVTISEIQPAEKFDKKFNKDFLYRVGNEGNVALGSLFKAKDNATIGTVSVEIEPVDNTGATGTYTANSSDWTKGTIDFNGTGVVKVTIEDDDTYCKPTELLLEVVDAVNATSATNATANNVVLLNDITSGFTVSGRYAVYGNGFTLNYTGNGQYLNNGLKQGIVTVSENGTLDNLRIKATIYPNAYLYYGSTQLGDYVQGGPSSVEGDKTRYHYQLSAVAAKDNATISNCYIYGGRTNIYVNTGDVTIKDTILECGVVANVQIQSNNSHTITLENVTTIQHQNDPTIGDTSKVMLGTGILVGPETNDNPTLVLNGEFKQYNWVTKDDENAVSDELAKKIIAGAVEATEYNHTINGKTASNLGIIYMNTYETKIQDNTGLSYELGNISMSGIDGQVYSLQNATDEQIYSDYETADKSTVNGLYQPQFKYVADLGGQYIEKTDDSDEHCYREGDTVYVMFPSGDTKELDLGAFVDINKYTKQNLNLAISCKDENGNAVTVTDGKISLSDAGKYTVTYSVTDKLFYNKDGNIVDGSLPYSYDVTLVVSLKDKAIPNAYFEFDSSKQIMGYAKKSAFAGGNTQYLPFLAGLKIYDYIGQDKYLRFDGDNDFNKIASATITGYTSANHVLMEVKLTDGGVINIDTTARAASGGSTYTGKIQTSGNTIYYVNDGTTSATTTTWVISSYKFTGNNGVAIDSGSVTFSNCENGSVPTGSFGTTIKYTVTYDANEGNCGQATGYATSASAAVTLPTPTRSGYIFSGWYTAASGGTRVGGSGDSYAPSSNITLYAQWGKPCTVTYNANGGSCGTSSEKYTGTALTLPTPTRDGYWFIGWYDAAEGGSKIGDAGATYNPSGEITLYAHWQEKIEYTVTYNANGGNCGTASATYQGTPLTLPTSTRTGYTFKGWYTATSGGVKIGDAGAQYIPSANITLYAQWEKTPYKITVSTNNATVSGVTNGQTAYYGDTITFTVTYSGNSNKKTTVTGSNGDTISTTGSYTFTMPASNVTISASSSSSCVTGDTLITLADGSQKRIDEVSYDDEFIVWDFVTGEYTVKPAAIINNHGYGNYIVTTVCFENGKSVNTIGGHGFYHVDTNRFVMLDETNVADYVGHDFVMVTENGNETTKLVDYRTEEKYTESWSVLTAEHHNCIAQGMLTLTPGEVTGSENYLMPFTIGDDMKYDEDAMKSDIETYGLYTYEDFSDYVTYEQFMGLNLPIFKVSKEKGYITYDDIIFLLQLHMNH